MATRAEIENRWAELPLGKKQEVSQSVLGHPHASIAELVEHANGKTGGASLLSYKLGLETEADRADEATIAAGRFAKRSYNLGLAAFVISILSAILAGLAVVLASLAIFAD